MSELPKNFCYAPFIHMYIHSNEGERVCCMSTDEMDNMVKDWTETDLKKRWTNEYLTSIRRDFLDNKRPSMCSKCFALEDSGGTSDRNRFSNSYNELDIIPNIETGNQYNSPIDLDIRPGNLCNLGCRMCGPVASSVIQKEVTKDTTLEPVFGRGNIRESSVLQNEYNIEFLLKNADKGRRVKFLGGEPTIMPEVDKFLDILIERNMLDVPIHFTTNCTNGNKRFIDKISKFNEISFNYSIDGIENTVEYIRHPVKFNSINKNIRVYHSLASYGEITYTLQAYNLFNLHDMLNWSSEIGIYTRPELLIAPDPLSCLSIPKKIRDKRIRILIKLLDNMKTGNLNRSHIKKKVMPVLDRLYNDDREFSLHDLAKRTKIVDRSRKQHIKDYVPEVWDFIKEEYDAIQL